MSKVIGITVGTPISKEKIKEISGEVKTVNGVKPDDNGDVKITIPEQVTIDNSLTVEGAAADAKTVGDSLNAIKMEFQNSMIEASKLAEMKANKATVVNSSSTDEQYPSAKAVYSYVNTTVSEALNVVAAAIDEVNGEVI